MAVRAHRIEAEAMDYKIVFALFRNDREIVRNDMWMPYLPTLSHIVR